MQITVEIEPQKLHIFLEQIKNIEGFLGLKTPIAEQLSASQKTLWAKIKIGLDEIKLSEQGKIIGVPLHELWFFKSYCECLIFREFQPFGCLN